MFPRWSDSDIKDFLFLVKKEEKDKGQRIVASAILFTRPFRYCTTHVTI
jgi:hypothetical protein